MEMMKYPNTPGYKVSGTSAEAAGSMSAKAVTLRGDCLTALNSHGDMTADECASQIGAGILSIRPRFSELKRMGRIIDSGARRKNHTGKTATVWTVTPLTWVNLHNAEQARKVRFTGEV